MGKFWFGMFFLLKVSIVFAQKPTGIKGKIIDSKTQKPLENVVITIENTTLMQLTTSDGVFSFYAVVSGNQLLLLHSQGFKDVILPVVIKQDQMLDLGAIPLEDNQTSEQLTGI